MLFEPHWRCSHRNVVTWENMLTRPLSAAVQGLSIDETGKQHYLDASVAYKRAVLNCIDYLSKFGYTKQQVRGGLETSHLVQGDMHLHQHTGPASSSDAITLCAATKNCS